MTINDVYQEVVSITQTLIENGLSVQEKWPIREGNNVSWQDQSDISIALKNIPYSDKYLVLEKERNYNFKMLDGALLQFMYSFGNNGRTLLSHRLAFFPSPNIERYDDVPEDYETKYFGDSEFHDQFEKNIIAFPIRFDFNIDPKIFKEVTHPYSHVHFGEYEFCRIPVCSPVTPTRFINFILWNFYNYAIQTKGDIIPLNKSVFSNTIEQNEMKVFHFNFH